MRNFSEIAQLAVNSRDGIISAADGFYPYDPLQPQKGANVAHYSANGTEFATARHWGGMQG